MFYKLYSKGVLRNTKSDYTGLSEHTADAREIWIRKVGDEDERLPPDCFLDEIHSVLEIDDVYRSPEEHVKEHTDALKELPQKYPALPRWYNQPEYVEIWIEKNAMVAEFQSILNEAGLEVRLVPHGGYVSFTFLNESVQRLFGFVRQGKNIRVLYFGDSPSLIVLYQWYDSLFIRSLIFQISFRVMDLPVRLNMTFIISSSAIRLIVRLATMFLTRLLSSFVNLDTLLYTHFMKIKFYLSLPTSVKIFEGDSKVP